MWFSSQQLIVEKHCAMTLKTAVQQTPFLGANRSGTGAIQKIDSTLILLLYIKRTSKQGTQNPSYRLKYHFSGKKDDSLPQVR